MVINPNISLENFWAKALKNHWGIEAKLSSLPGELDQNFLAQEKNGTKCIIKIMREDCPNWLVKAQIEVIEHLYKTDPNLKVPKVLKSLDGNSFICEADRYGFPRFFVGI